ncbi:MAG: GAF domain-containing protein, partial [Actinomycetota bacterium]|nr:GAF domain-containing protein [Actinomycetota bacterium]
MLCDGALDGAQPGRQPTRGTRRQRGGRLEEGQAAAWRSLASTSRCAAGCPGSTPRASSRPLISALELRSAMIVPLTARGRTLGAMALASAESGRRFDSEDLRIAEDLAARCALAADNARFYRHERTIAETLQRTLLPGGPSRQPGPRRRRPLSARKPRSRGGGRLVRRARAPRRHVRTGDRGCRR